MGYKKYLLYCQIDTLCRIGISVENMIKELSKLRYWCYAEHVTPSGRNITYVYLEFYNQTMFKNIEDIVCPFCFHTSVYSDCKSSRLIRDYVKSKGFSLNLGKSKPIPGTFNEKKGGL